MTQEEKDLLLKDLCARLPYGVKVRTTYISPKTKKRDDVGIDVLCAVGISMLIEGYEEHKPYLFPLSSMTEEQYNEYNNMGYSVTERGQSMANYHQIDWFHKNHIDYRGLIPMGLAIDATGLNIY